MTKVARLIAEDNSRGIAKKMLTDGLDIAKIIMYTNLSEEEVEKIREELLDNIQNVK